MELQNIRYFKYRHKKYIISEIDCKSTKLKCCCMNKYGIISGLININLSNYDKQLELHKIVKQKKLKKCC